MRNIIYGDELYSDYSDLSGFWQDVKGAVGSVAKGVYSLVKPVAPDIIYKQVTGRERPPEKVYVTPPPRVKPAVPTWVLPAVGGGILILLLSRLKTAKRR